MEKKPDKIRLRRRRCQLIITGLIITGLLVFFTGCATPSRVYLPRPQAPPAGQTLPEKRPSSKPYEALGKRYVPMADATGFVQKGIASWYGGKFHGRKTASGEVYNQHKMTAAHTILPLGTYVKVINQENNRSVVVKVNDRGPFVKNRSIDLSYAAAKKLDMLRAGTAPVKIIALGDSPNAKPTPKPAVQKTRPKPAAPPAAPPPRQPAEQQAAPPPPQTQPEPVTQPPEWKPRRSSAAHKPCFVFQVGAFTTRENAERLKSELDQIYRNVHIVTHTEGSRVFYRVRLGRYDTREEIEQDRQRLLEAGFDNVTIVTE